jgi:hypothetical protein
MIVPLDDLDRIMAVMSAAFDPEFGEAWSRRQVEDALMIGNCHYGLAFAGGDCAGFFLSRAGVDEEELLLIAHSCSSAFLKLREDAVQPAHCWRCGKAIRRNNSIFAVSLYRSAVAPITIEEQMACELMH